MNYWWIGLGARLPLPIPWQTFATNFAGGLRIGWLANRLDGAQKLLWIAGFCGGFTTFSTYSMETVALLEQGKYAQTVANVVASATLCVAAAASTNWSSK
jgi:CrcB protein